LTRIFTVLALLAMLLLAANFVVGLAAGDFNAAAEQKRDAQNRRSQLKRQQRPAATSQSAEIAAAERAAVLADENFRIPRARMTLHMLLGAAAALVTLLVNSIAMTYFIGTSRWCKEVCETYKIAGKLAEQSTRLKRSTFPWALVGIVSVIAIVALGAAADPSGANWNRSAQFVMPHYLVAMLGIVLIGTAFWMQISRIAENYVVIEQILAEVERIRAARDVPTEEPITR
jgi:uncharacterized membrane protein